MSDKVSDAQNTAVEALLPIAFAGFRTGMLSLQKAPMTMEITENRVRFSGPESSVDMEVMKGFGGKAVKILNLPSPAYQDYTQFKSVSHTHMSATHVVAQRHERVHVDDGRRQRQAVRNAHHEATKSRRHSR